MKAFVLGPMEESLEYDNMLADRVVRKVCNQILVVLVAKLRRDDICKLCPCGYDVPQVLVRCLIDVDCVYGGADGLGLDELLKAVKNIL